MKSSALAHSVSEACSIANAGRTALYEAIRSGELRAVEARKAHAHSRRRSAPMGGVAAVGHSETVER